MPEITLEQGTIRYRELGPPDGPAVVFVHGFLVDGSLWDGVADRLASRGFRTLQPTLPLGAHAVAMNPAADLSPRGVARIVDGFMAAVGADDATLVGNDTGGAICQFLLDTAPARVGRLVLTNCDAFEVFPPRPFDLLVKLARHPALLRPAAAAMKATAVRNSILGYGGLVEHPLDPAQTRAWIDPYLIDAGVRDDVRRFCREVRPRDLSDIATRLRRFPGPVLLCWAPRDPFFTIALGRRLEAAFADARLVEIEDSRAFVPLDQPGRVADEIAAFAPAPVPA